MKTNSELTKDIAEMTRRIILVQEERQLTASQLIREFPQLGSAKSWTDRLVAGKFSELNLERWHKKLSDVCDILDGGTPDEMFYSDLPFARELHSRLLKLERQTNDRRILVCLAPNGTGKSAFGRWALAQSRTTRAYLRIRPTWRNKYLHIYTGLLRSIGFDYQGTNVADAENETVKALDNNPRTVFLDQAHEGGVALMHILRVLVDETKSRFVYAAYNTAYKQVLNGTADALVEAQAFLGRCMKPVFDLYSIGTLQEDVKFYLARVANHTDSSAASLSAAITPLLNQRNNLRLLDDAIEHARHACGKDDPDASTIKDSITKLSGLDVTNRNGKHEPED
ncbi:MAG TPA: hypothetical protein PKA41_08695 [Verrucomicrobiota bacterium]|nr:hypothetical protein [Verrucomicrobiota bacterium]